MIRFRTVLAATGLAVAAAAIAVAPADAEQVHHRWHWETSNSRGDLGYGSYNEDSNTLRVDDREKDGHSVYLYVDGPGWNNTEYWDKDGSVGSGTYFDMTDEYDTGDYVEVYLCTGDSDTDTEVACSGLQEGFTV